MSTVSNDSINSSTMASQPVGEPQGKTLERNMMSLLNKLAPDNRPTIAKYVMEQMEKLEERSAFETVGKMIFQKACREPLFRKLYAELCSFVSTSSKSDDFKKALLDNLDGWLKDNWAEAMAVDCSRQISIEYYTRVKCRFMGGMLLLGDLFNEDIVEAQTVHSFIGRLLSDIHAGSDIKLKMEAAVGLLTVVGKKLEEPQSQEKIEEYFKSITTTSERLNDKRTQFFVEDLVTLRNAEWVPDKVKHYERSAMSKAKVRETFYGISR